MPTARRVALECRAFQGQINCLRLPMATQPILGT
jgi:hypothetical protein